jgi:hypothetical protein
MQQGERSDFYNGLNAYAITDTMCSTCSASAVFPSSLILSTTAAGLILLENNRQAASG